MSAWRLGPAASALAVVGVRRRLTFDTCDMRSSVSAPSSEGFGGNRSDEDDATSSTSMCDALRENERVQKEQHRIRWNFDFDLGIPLDGRYQWSEMRPDERMIDSDGIGLTATTQDAYVASSCSGFVPIELPRCCGTVARDDRDDCGVTVAERWQPLLTSVVNAQTQTRPDVEFNRAAVDRGLPESGIDQNNNSGGSCDLIPMQVDDLAASHRVTCMTQSSVESGYECNSRRPHRQHGDVAVGSSVSAGRVNSRRRTNVTHQRLLKGTCICISPARGYYHCSF